MRALGRFIFWDFPRASWQYDLMVALILAFIFITPRDVFRDQPKAASVVMLPDDRGVGQYWIEPELLVGAPEGQLVPRASSLVKTRYKTRKDIVRVEPIFDSEKEIKGYMAFTEP